MKRLLVLGAGTAGTMVVNKLRHRLDRVAVADHDRRPGRCPPLPAGSAVRPVRRLPPGRDRQAPAPVHPGRRRPGARRDRPGRRRRQHRPPGATAANCGYDYLVIATGVEPAPGSDARHARAAVAAQHLRLLHPRRCDRAREALDGLRRRPARRARRRHADQVPGRAAGVHLPRRGVLPRPRHPGLGSRSST